MSVDAWCRPRQSDLPFLREPERVQGCHRLWLPGPLSPMPLLSMPAPSSSPADSAVPSPRMQVPVAVPCKVMGSASLLRLSLPRSTASARLWGRERCRAGA